MPVEWILLIVSAGFFLTALVFVLYTIVIVFRKTKQQSSQGQEIIRDSYFRDVDRARGDDVMVGATHAIASTIDILSDEIRRFNESTEKLGKANIAIAAAIVLSGLAYTLAYIGATYFRP